MFMRHAHGLLLLLGWPCIPVIDLGCNMQLVIVELLSDDWQSLIDLEPAVLQNPHPYVMQALQQAQQVFLSGCVGVHGDLRQPNVAVKHEGTSCMAKFVDFDCAGLAGLPKYPPSLNSTTAWPEGTHSLAVMLSQQDSGSFQARLHLGRGPGYHHANKILIYCRNYVECCRFSLNCTFPRTCIRSEHHDQEG